MASIITLTTDFGLADHYVAAMKGVILSTNPEAIIVDVTHDVAPQQVVQAVYLTGSAWPHFPHDAIHVAVVDPGVGTHRRALLLQTPSGLHAGPDNGVLSAALPEEARRTIPGDSPEDIALPEGYRAFQIAEPRFMRMPVSDTFHGRDIFAPAAAHLSLGVPPEDFGEAVSSMLALPPIRAPRRPGGALAARVIHVDRFGNLLTDALAQDLPAGRLRVKIAGRTVTGPVRTYADAQGLVAMLGSSGYLEVAEPGGSAAAVLGVGPGEPLLVRTDR
jgi:S-adenosylmethionine hydrolase